MKALLVCVLAVIAVVSAADNPCVPPAGTDDVTITYHITNTETCMTPCQQCTPVPGKTKGLYYTTFNGGKNVWRADLTIDDTVNPPVIAAANLTNLAALPGSDGIVGSPRTDRILYLGAQNFDGVNVLNLDTGHYVYAAAPAGTGVYHLVVVTAGMPGTPFLYGVDLAHKVARWPILSDGNLGTSVAVTFSGLPYGNTPTTIIPVPNGQFYFTYDGTPKGAGGSIGHFGTVTWNADGTVGTCTILGSGEDLGGCYHSGQYDPYTNSILLWGGNEICQYFPDIDEMNTVFDPTATQNPPLAIFDQGTSDGMGHVFIADNNGRLVWLDISKSRDITALDNFGVLFTENSLDDVAPLIGAGSAC